MHYGLSTLPERTSSKRWMARAMGQWMTERDYHALKSEFAQSHYEGRNRAFHHHATLSIETCWAQNGLRVRIAICNAVSQTRAKQQGGSGWLPLRHRSYSAYWSL